MRKRSNMEIEKELQDITAQLLIESGTPYKSDIKLSASLQRHLGIDSLGRAELFKRIEKNFDLNIPDRVLAEAENLKDIARFIEQASPALATIKPSSAVVTSHGERSHVDPSSAGTLVDVLYEYAEQAPHKTHVYFTNEDGQEELIQYDQLLKNALRAAHTLHELGLKPGETVAIMLPTQPGFFYTFLGVLLAGGIPVPIYPPFRMHMLEAYAKTEAHILRNAEVRILVTFTQVEKLSRLLQAFVPSLKHVVTVDVLLQSEGLQGNAVPKPNDFAFIQYTSGSTADPKGVLLSHQNLLTNIRAYGKTIKVTPDDVVVSWLPLYHDMGLIGMWLGSLYFGLPLILLTPFSFLNHPERWLWAIHHHRATLSGAPNFAYELCVRKIEPGSLEGLDLSTWRIAANGAEKVYPRTLQAFAEKFAPYKFNRHALLPVYGLAESTVALTIPPLGREFWVDDVDRKLFEEKRIAAPATDHSHALSFVSCGKAIVGHEIRVIDEAGEVLPERRVGNLQFRGPSSMQGYFNNPDATKAVYHAGWFDTGDLAYLADNELFITGRRKDLIIKAGRNLYPAEIEELVGSVPGVRQGSCIAFGLVDSGRATEQLVIVAETRERDSLKRAQIADAIKEAVATTLDIVPDEVVMVAPHIVPKTSSGKLQRAACKAMYQQGQLTSKQPAWIQVTKLSTQWFLRKLQAMFLTLGRLIYSVYFVCIFVITFLPLYVFVRISSRDRAATACFTWSRWFLAAVFCPITMTGRENLTKDLPLIYTLNHASYIDAIVAAACVPASTRFVGKKELLDIPFIRTLMRKLEFIAVDRVDLPKGIEDAKQIRSNLEAGHSILIFPEGTFAYALGLRPFRLGAFKAAVDAQVSVCPIAIHGTRLILRDGDRLIKPHKIQITVCEPIKPSGSEWQDVIKLRDRVRAEIAKYCGEPSLDFIVAQTIAPGKNETV